MTWPRNIEQWRQYTIWESKDIPTDLVLAIIQHESAGQAGRASNATTKPWAIPKMDGTTITYNRALGLMQCIPRTIATYNELHPDQPAFFEDMTGAAERASRLQIRMGSEVYAWAVQALYRYDPRAFPGPTPGRATADQLKLALVAYAVGFGALKKKLDVLKERGIPLTFANVAQAFPNWGRAPSGEWINRPLHYAKVVWERFKTQGEPGKPGIGEPDNPKALPGLDPARPADNSKVIIAGVVLLAAAFMFDKDLGNPFKSLLRGIS